MLFRRTLTRSTRLSRSWNGAADGRMDPAAAFRMQPLLKRVVKLGISLLVHAWDLTWQALSRAAGRVAKGTCVVLYYHGIEPNQREHFGRQLDNLLRLAKPIAAGLRERLTRGQHHCAVTFDDGFVSVIENGLPELE